MCSCNCSENVSSWFLATCHGDFNKYLKKYPEGNLTAYKLNPAVVKRHCKLVPDGYCWHKHFCNTSLSLTFFVRKVNSRVQESTACCEHRHLISSMCNPFAALSSVCSSHAFSTLLCLKQPSIAVVQYLTQPSIPFASWLESVPDSLHAGSLVTRVPQLLAYSRPQSDLYHLENVRRHVVMNNLSFSPSINQFLPGRNCYLGTVITKF